MKELVENSILNRVELCDWFGIKPMSFSCDKQTKLEELKDFCDYELIETKGGNFKGVHILKVYVPVYCRKMNPLKKKFLDWIENGGLKEAAFQTEYKTYSYVEAVNYFCHKNNIPYDGAHYQVSIEDGRNTEGNKIFEGSRKVTNKEYKEWHYLYRILKKYQMDNDLKCGPSVSCCAKGFNPIVLRLETPEDRELQNKIYQKYFGKLSYEDVCELVDQVTAMVDRGEITEQDKDFMIENQLMRTMSSKQKRQMAAKECAEIGVLRRKGYIYSED